ncbi:MAG: ABC transporter permease/substrate-binding protein [Acidobacteria bacterium]|nr:ABC transporter permease/substrate-binding protein [Acidobacteriota bacterium]
MLDFLKSNWPELLSLTGEHLRLVAVAVAVAVAIGLPVGILLTRREKLKGIVLGVAGVLQTVPSLALFGFLIPLSFVGVGARAAVVALVVYALLPIIRNTVTGIEGVDAHVREAAVGMGMTRGQILRQVELPLALPVILAGVRVATVISVGVATIAAAIGAGGLGTYIFRGLRMDDDRLLLAGALPAALMALAFDWLIGLLETELGARPRATSPAARRARLLRLIFAAALIVAALGLGLKHQPVTDPRAVYEQVRREYAERFAVETGPPLGFSNDFAILVRGRDARELRLRTISDAAAHAPRWRAGFGQDFMSRPDGYAGFARAYDLKFRARPREMDLSLTYRALAAGEVDVIAGNSTDGLIGALDLFQLADDRRYFPPYEAVFFARRDALGRAPQLGETLRRLGGAITTEEMRRLNLEVDGRKRGPAEVVREWRRGRGL